MIPEIINIVVYFLGDVHIAAELGIFEAFDKLSNSKIHNLVWASRNGYFQIAKKLILSSNINDIDEAVDIAAVYGNVDIVLLLLKSNILSKKSVLIYYNKKVYNFLQKHRLTSEYVVGIRFYYQGPPNSYLWIDIYKVSEDNENSSAYIDVIPIQF